MEGGGSKLAREMRRVLSKFHFFSPSRDFACIFNLATTLWHARSAISSASSREQCGKGGEGLAGKGGDPSGLLTLE